MQKDRSLSILEEIEKRKAVPIPRWWFRFKQFGFWVLAAISVLTGAISMATAIYVFLDHDFIEDHEYINRLFIERPLLADIISSIPYLWLGALALFILVAFFGFRHTKKGYRYATTRVIAASLFASLLLSLCLNMVDLGGYIHRFLIENVHVYNKLLYTNEQRWTRSEKGLLGGKIIAHNKRTHMLVVKDFNKVLWQVDISKSEMQPETHIVPGHFVKMTGLKTGKGTFQALSIQAWEKKYHKRVRQSKKIIPTNKQPEPLNH